MPNLRGSEWLIIILLVVLLFGAKRMPDAARSVGRSLRIFKAETKGLVTDDDARATGSQTGAVPPAVTGSPGSATPPAAPAAGQPTQAPQPGTPVTPPTNQA
jgi:sec-independent protein translocase protein TatA